MAETSPVMTRYRRRPRQIRISPSAASAAPYQAHWVCVIMKLEAGQAITPVP